MIFFSLLNLLLFMPAAGTSHHITIFFYGVLIYNIKCVWPAIMFFKIFFPLKVERTEQYDE